MISRRRLIAGTAAGFVAIATGCTDNDNDNSTPSVDSNPATTDVPGTENGGRWLMPAEEALHDATWMSWKTPRGTGDTFLSSYVNYYVCNGAVIAPQFGDIKADEAAAATLQRLYPDRTIVQLNIDPIAAGGGGIHCATQQQPSTA